MKPRNLYLTTAAVLLVAAIFQVWWTKLDGLMHWQGLVAVLSFGVAGYLCDGCIRAWRDR